MARTRNADSTTPSVWRTRFLASTGRRRGVVSAGPPVALWLAWLLVRFDGLLSTYNVFPYNRTFPSNTDVNLYYQWSYLMWHGLIPYRNFEILYPPGILPILALPPISSSVYGVEFFVAALLVDAYVFFALYRSGRRAGALVWLVGAPLLGPIFWARLDIFVAGALVAGILALEKGHYRRAGLFFSYAALLKLWPIVLVILVLRSVPRTSWRRLLTWSGGIFVVPIALFVLIGGAKAMWSVVTVQTGRGVEIESVFALPLIALIRAGHQVPVVIAASIQFAGPTDQVVADIATAFFVVAIGLCLLKVVRNRTPPLDPTAWLLLFIALVLATSKVLSPQYLVWAVAGVALFVDRLERKGLLLIATAFVLLMTQLQFPFLFIRLADTLPIALPLSAVHAVSVVAFAVVVYWSVRANAKSSRSPDRVLVTDEHSQEDGALQGV